MLLESSAMLYFFITTITKCVLDSNLKHLLKLETAYLYLTCIPWSVDSEFQFVIWQHNFLSIVSAGPTLDYNFPKHNIFNHYCNLNIFMNKKGKDWLILERK